MTKKHRPVPPKFDLTGKTFGRLTVLRQAENLKVVGKGRYPQFHRAWHVRCSCGVEKVVSGNCLRQRADRSTKSCGCLRRERSSELSKRTGPESRGWKGGLSTTRDGYVRCSRIRLPDGTEALRYFQHRALMENHLGRRLLPGENVHHRNGKRDDNRLENLELWVKFQPAGQRVEDVVAHAKAILRRYEPASLKEG